MRQARIKHGIRPVFKRVDTCAAEFEAHTPYLYSTYEKPQQEESVGGVAGKISVENEARPTGKKKIVILGGGPNRIGQGIEFDYCCVHAVQALREDGFETIMVNCNPETVSTDYDTSDRLYFEPLTREDVLEILDVEKPEGVIVQFGGQTPLRLAVPLQNAGVKLLGTSADAIDRAEDRQRFGELLRKLDLRAPAWGTANGLDEARQIAERIGYPVMVRPSYVLGGRAMEIVHDPSGLEHFVYTAMEASRRESLSSRAGEKDRRSSSTSSCPTRSRSTSTSSPTGPSRSSAASWSTSRRPASTRATRRAPAAVLAAARDRRGDEGAGARAGARSSASRPHERAVRGAARRARHLHPRGQPARVAHRAVRVQGDRRAAGEDRGAHRGRQDAEGDGRREVTPTHVAVKEAVFPFAKFPGVDTILGPEMRSTGEVMGIDETSRPRSPRARSAPARGCR